MSNKKAIVSIPPFWAGVIVLFPAFLLFVILALLGIEARNKLNPRESAIVTLIFMIALLTRYDICKASIMLTLYPCKTLDRNKNNIALFKWLHPLKAIRLYIPEGQEEVCLRTIEGCIGGEKCLYFPERD